MEYLCQEKNPLLELIKERMIELGWVNKKGEPVQAQLAKISGTSTGPINRLFKHNLGISYKNLYKILDSLGLLKSDNEELYKKLIKTHEDNKELINENKELNNKIEELKKRWKYRHDKKGGLAK